MATQSTPSVSASLAMRSRRSSHSKPTSTTCQPLSFSISNILGLKDDTPLSQASLNSAPTEPMKCFTKSSKPHLDLTSSSSDCDSEYDHQLPTPSEKPSKKRRQRTAFSAQEVWAMQRAFRRSPYLLGEDEMYLVQRLGIPAKRLRLWFQNQRARSKRERRDKPGVCRISLSSRLECPAGLRFPVQCHPYSSAESQVAHIRIERVWSEAEKEPNYQPRFHEPVVEGLHHPSIKPNQFNRTATDPNDQPHAKLQMETRNYNPSKANQLKMRSFGLPMFHQDQLKYSAEPTRKRRYSRASNRFQPYLI